MHQRTGSARALCALALGIALLDLGCRLPEPDFEGTVVTLVSADAALAARVQQALADDGVPVDEVRVTVVNGVVALSGRVPSDEDRSDAEALARKVRGVYGVRNELEVPAAVPAAGALPRLRQVLAAL